MKKTTIMFIMLLMLEAVAYAAPFGVLLTNVQEPIAITSSTHYSKEGSSRAFVFLWLIALGDASTTMACKSTSIKKIHHIDKGSFYFLFGLFGMETTIVYGD